MDDLAYFSSKMISFSYLHPELGKIIYEGIFVSLNCFLSVKIINRKMVVKKETGETETEIKTIKSPGSKMLAPKFSLYKVEYLGPVIQKGRMETEEQKKLGFQIVQAIHNAKKAKAESDSVSA